MQNMMLYVCECSAHQTGILRKSCNMCEPNPCKNNGVCSKIENVSDFLNCELAYTILSLQITFLQISWSN
jgi:hypothetical protein